MPRFMNNQLASLILLELLSLVAWGSLIVNKNEIAKCECSLTDSIPYWSKILHGSYVGIVNQGDATINPNLDPEFKQRLSIDDKGNLVIANVQLTDAGKYVCSYIGKGEEITELVVQVQPEMPHISNTETTGGRILVQGIEDQSVTLTCVSRGGYPEPMVTWTRGSVFLDATSHTSHTDTDGNYVVTITYTFTAHRNDDRVTFSCQSSLRATDQPLISNVTLYLKLKPSQPVTSVLSNVTEGSQTTLQCLSSGCRPKGEMSWKFDASSISGSVNFSNDITTETYSMLSSYSTRVLQRNDNGKTVECIVTHEALITPSQLEQSTVLNVTFAPLSVQMSGNRQITADGVNPLNLTCVTGTANPAGNISWMNGSDPITSGITGSQSSGNYGGTVVTETLTLRPTRYMDGDVISCTTTNTVSQPTGVRNETILALNYKPITTISGASERTLTEGDTNIVLQCSAQSKPVSSFTWYHGSNKADESGDPQASNQYNLTITKVQRTHYGSYMCQAKNVVASADSASVHLKILFAPLSVQMSGNHQITANGINPLNLTCVTGTANPAGNISWRNGSNLITNGINTSRTSGDYGGTVLTETLTLRPNRYMDGDVISCTTANSVSHPAGVRNETILDLNYQPLTFVSTEVNATEDEPSVTLRCSASSKPPSTFKWFKSGSNTVLYQGNGSSNANHLDYVLEAVSRDDAGQYKCEANNNIGTPDNGLLMLNVLYPPDVFVRTTNATVNDLQRTLTCNASGFPSTYTYSEWTQTWPGSSTILRTHPGTREWILSNLTYDDTGIYQCGASNNVARWNTVQTIMKGSVFLFVQSDPVVTKPLQKDVHKIPAILGENFTVVLQIYSNDDNIDEVDVSLHVNDTLIAIDSSHITKEVGDVELPLHSKRMTTKGIHINVTSIISSQDEFGLFHIKIQNPIGSTIYTFEAVPEGPPCTPIDPVVDDPQQNTVIVSWIRCFHGGFAQIFVVQYGTNKVSWINASAVDGGLSTSRERLNTTVTNLQPDTSYYIRIFSFNKKGRSGYTDFSFVKTQPKDTKESPTSITAAAVGGSVGGAVIMSVVIVGVVFVRRRSNKKAPKGTQKKSLIDSKKKNVTSTDDIEEVANPMYEPAGALQSTSYGAKKESSGDLYSTPMKSKGKIKEQAADLYAVPKKNTGKKTESPGDLYSVPVKNKGKQKKEKQQKEKNKKEKKNKNLQGNVNEGMVYENAAELGVCAPDTENAYELTETTSKSSEPSRIKNADGLIYLEVDVSRNKAGNKTVVIHGLDDRTEYADIAFGKVGEPAPESDDEEKKEDTKEG